MRYLLPLLAAALLAAGPKEMAIWPGDAPGSEGRPNQEVAEKGADGEIRTRLVTRPTITVHLPAPDKANGTAMIVCPGGGYRHHAIEKEGHDVAKWLAGLGVAGIVLKYRVNLAEPVGREVVSGWALADAKQAMKAVRAHAREWGVNPDRVGIMGFSAGGHLAANLGMNYDAMTRPAFLGIFYGSAPEGAFPAGAPPAFIAHADDDPTVPVIQATRLFDGLKKVKTPAELHVFAKGGHGFGIRKKGVPSDSWTERFREWLDFKGWLTRQ